MSVLHFAEPHLYYANDVSEEEMVSAMLSTDNRFLDFYECVQVELESMCFHATAETMSICEVEFYRGSDPLDVALRIVATCNPTPPWETSDDAL